MARISIFDPDPDVAQLFAHMVERLGHEPADDAASADAAIVDVDTPLGCETARESKRAGVAVVCVSVYPPYPEWGASVPGPLLVKPFRQGDLGEALSHVVGSPAAPGHERACRMGAAAD